MARSPPGPAFARESALLRKRRTAERGPGALLLTCLSVKAGSRLPDLVPRASVDDWNEALDAAVREHVAPLLFKRLKERDARTCVPDSVWKQLRLAYFTSGDRNTRLYRELRTVLECLRSAGIPVIVLKGAYLAEAVYRDVGLRPMCDSDLMVPRQDLERAEAVLLNMGAVYLKRPPLTPEEGFGQGCGKADHARPVAIRDLAIEIHWTIAAPNGPVRTEVVDIWKRARPTRTAEVEVLSLSPEDLLLHLCLHLCYHHNCVGLRSLCDIGESVHRFSGAMDWRQVTGSARAWGGARYVGLALHLARSLLAADVPADVLERLVPGGLDPRVLKAASATVTSGIPFDRWLSPAFLGLKGPESPARKLGRVWERTFLSRDAMFAEYPAARESGHRYIFHARRVWDILRKWGPALGRIPGHEWKRNLADNSVLSDWLKSDEP